MTTQAHDSYAYAPLGTKVLIARLKSTYVNLILAKIPQPVIPIQMVLITVHVHRNSLALIARYLYSYAHRIHVKMVCALSG